MFIKNLIIGAGPAGIQMGHLLSKDYLIVEKGSEPCSFFRKFPRQRRFISINKGRELRYDWNSFISPGKESLRDYTEKVYPDADTYLQYVNDFVKNNNINIRFDFEVKKIEKKKNKFLINDGEIEAERVFFGIGVVPKKMPDVKFHPAIKVFTYDSMPIDPEVYRDKFVHIIGGGNAALETADYIEPWTDVTEIWGAEKKAWQTHYPGHQRSVNFRAIDSYYLKARTVFHFGEKDIPYNESYDFKNLVVTLSDEAEHQMYEKTLVIWCVGFEFDSTLVKDLVEVDRFPVLTPNFESTKCPGLFFIGAATQHHDWKKGTSAFIHGFRYNCEYLYKYLTNNITYTFIDNPPALVKKVFDQLNNSSALFHRFDQFCDLVGLGEDGFHYIQEIPFAAVNQFVQPSWSKYFTINLGYTRDFADTFQQVINNHPRDAEKSKFIHPLIRFGPLTFHIPEEAINEFKSEVRHIYPFRLYLAHIMGHLTLDEVKMRINQIE